MAIAVSSTRLSTLGLSDANPWRMLTLGATPADGATILISMAFATTSRTIDSIVDKAGNVYVAVGDSGVIASLNVRVHLWACYGQHGLQSGDWVYVQFSGNSATAMAIDEVTGLGSAHVPDKTKIGSSTTATSSVSTGASAATAYTNELVWCLIGTPTTSGTTQSITAGGSYTQQGARVTTTNISLYVEYLIVSATGAQTATATLNTTTSAYAAMLFTIPDPQSPDSTYRRGGFVAAEVAYTGSQRAAGFVGAEVATGSMRVDASFAGAEIALIGANRAAGFVGTEVALTGQSKAAGFVGVEVAHGTLLAGAGFVGVEIACVLVPPASTARRPSPIIVG